MRLQQVIVFSLPCLAVISTGSWLVYSKVIDTVISGPLNCRMLDCISEINSASWHRRGLIQSTSSQGDTMDLLL